MKKRYFFKELQFWIYILGFIVTTIIMFVLAVDRVPQFNETNTSRNIELSLSDILIIVLYCICGMLPWVIMIIRQILDVKKNNYLFENGVCIKAKVVNVSRKLRNAQNDNIHKRFFVYTIECDGEYNGQRLTFIKKNIRCNPSHLLDKLVDVYIAPDNPKKYYVDCGLDTIYDVFNNMGDYQHQDVSLDRINYGEKPESIDDLWFNKGRKAAEAEEDVLNLDDTLDMRKFKQNTVNNTNGESKQKKKKDAKADFFVAILLLVISLFFFQVCYVKLVLVELNELKPYNYYYELAMVNECEYIEEKECYKVTWSYYDEVTYKIEYVEEELKYEVTQGSSKVIHKEYSNAKKIANILKVALAFLELALIFGMILFFIIISSMEILITSILFVLGLFFPGIKKIERKKYRRK